jgi:nucleotide-binding universal stress UspA family protein
MSDERIEFKRVLIGLDDHEQARDALSLGAAVAQTFGSEVIVAAAINYDPLPIGRVYYDRARTDHFARLFAAAGEHLGKIPFRSFELDGEPTSSLPELAARESVDLVVIGSTHRGMIERALRGTVADALVTEDACPVLVAPHGYAGREHAGFGTIAVGFDGSASAALAVEVAEGFAEALSCELRIVAVVPSYEDVPDPLRATREGVYRERLAIGRRAVTRVPVTEVVDFGDAPKELARQGLDADCLVVGSRGHGRLARGVLGSVASELVRIAPCPVLVVPTDHLPHRRRPSVASAGSDT